MTIKRGRRPGAYAVEFAVIASLLFLFIFAILDYGRFVMMRDLLDNAAQRGARQAIVNTDAGNDSDIEATVKANLAGQNLENMTITTYKVDPSTGQNLGAWKDSPFGTAIAVKVEGNYHPLFPTLSMLPNPVKMQAVSVMRSEGK